MRGSCALAFRTLFLRSAAAAIAIGTIAVGPMRPAGANPTGEVLFQIWREGQAIGLQRLSFRRDGDTLIVEAKAQIEVKAWFLTVYTYSQTILEVWKDGRLVKFQSRTFDDGQEFKVDGHATTDGFVVANESGQIVAPANVVPASYWNPRTPSQTKLLDPRTGRLLSVRFRSMGYERIKTADRQLTSRRYEVDGDVKVTLWYDSRHLLAQAFYYLPQDGSLIRYQRGNPSLPTESAAR